MSSNSALRRDPDQVLVDIAEYVLHYKIESGKAFDAARLCVIDALACALDALDSAECLKLLGPLVPGTVVPRGARLPGTSHELDPATAAFSLGCMIRWLDFNDTFTAVKTSHPSDNLAGILMLADYISRQRTADRGGQPLIMTDVFETLIKAYEIQGCLAMKNDFSAGGMDHTLLTRVASTAVLTRMLGGTCEQIINAVSNAWIDSSIAVFRHAPNTGWRKSWAAADASLQAMRLGLMAVKGEMGYPSVMTAPRHGFHDARMGGNPLVFERPYGDYVIQHSMFKFVPAGMFAQSGAECAFCLHPLVKDRLDAIERVEIQAHSALMGIMNKTGPLHNPADRDHCLQYIVAMGLIHGKLEARDFEDGIAADPRIDRLRGKMYVTEDSRFSRDFLDPAKRSNANALTIYFRDGSSTPRLEIEYPIGHPRRRLEVMPVLRNKFEAAIGRRFDAKAVARILAACDDPQALADLPVNSFVDLFEANTRKHTH